MSQNIVVTGGSGLIGRALIAELVRQGNGVTRLVRGDSEAAGTLSWNPERGDCPDLSGFDVVINLSGASIGKLPWTKRHKEDVLRSRISSTQTLVEAIERATRKPKLLISASGSGYYGNRGDAALNEASEAGTGFLASVTSAWEAAASAASCRVVTLRTGIVLSPKGGALGKLLPLVKLGLGGPLGSGKQWWPWISLEDEVGAIVHLAKLPDSAGPYNLVAPEEATCATLVKTLAKAFRRPSWLPVPGFALRILLGEAADELLLGSQRIAPERLLASGYRFRFASLEAACENLAKG